VGADFKQAGYLEFWGIDTETQETLNVRQLQALILVLSRTLAMLEGMCGELMSFHQALKGQLVSATTRGGATH